MNGAQIRGTSSIGEFNAIETISNLEQVDLRTWLLNNTAWNGQGSIRCILTITGTIGSRDPSIPALRISGFTEFDTIQINNNGRILGAGGYGTPYTPSGNSTGYAGGNGGDAILVESATTIVNEGLIYAGGGGAGSGGGVIYHHPYECGGWHADCSGGKQNCIGWWWDSRGCGCWCCYKCRNKECLRRRDWYVQATCWSRHASQGGAGGRGQGYDGANTIGALGGAFYSNWRAGSGGTGGSWGVWGGNGQPTSVWSGSSPGRGRDVSGGMGGAPGYAVRGWGSVQYYGQGSTAGFIG